MHGKVDYEALASAHSELTELLRDARERLVPWVTLRIDWVKSHWLC